jgi:hypothetical protein
LAQLHPLGADTAWCGESVVNDVPRIARGRGLEEDHGRFLVCAGPMIEALRDDAKLASVENDDTVSEL